jgi:hypothetical protein
VRCIAVLLGVALALPAEASSIDKAPIRRRMRANFPKFVVCYEAALAKTPGIAGRVVVKFTLDKDGYVVDSTAQTTPEMAAVGACIAKVVAKIRFPAYGGSVVVSYPFNFAPDTSR